MNYFYKSLLILKYSFLMKKEAINYFFFLNLFLLSFNKILFGNQYSDKIYLIFNF
jgi:hypothetical protein